LEYSSSLYVDTLLYGADISSVDQIKRIRHDSQIEHEFSIFWVPRRTVVSDQLLEEAGVLGDASVSEWPLYFVPLADDVLSLELEDAVSDLYLVCLHGLSKWEICMTNVNTEEGSYLDLYGGQIFDAATAEIGPLSTYHWKR
jgi:hypothetical protein